MATKLGKNCKLYYDASVLLTAATNVNLEALTLVEVDVVRDLTQNLEKDEVDVTTRGNAGWKQFTPGTKDGGLSFEVAWDPTSSAFAVLIAAWENDTEVAMTALDGDKTVSGSQGIASNFHIMNFTRNEPVDGAVTAQVECKPSSYTFWYEKA